MIPGILARAMIAGPASTTRNSTRKLKAAPSGRCRASIMVIDISARHSLRSRSGSGGCRRRRCPGGRRASAPRGRRSCRRPGRRGSPNRRPRGCRSRSAGRRPGPPGRRAAPGPRSGPAARPPGPAATGRSSSITSASARLERAEGLGRLTVHAADRAPGGHTVIDDVGERRAGEHDPAQLAQRGQVGRLGTGAGEHAGRRPPGRASRSRGPPLARRSGSAG